MFCTDRTIPVATVSSMGKEHPPLRARIFLVKFWSYQSCVIIKKKMLSIIKLTDFGGFSFWLGIHHYESSRVS